ncbi:F-box/FBD/LRR-repeat protein At1g13570-like [Bidens hawaiensis]|uniref:F-box/FBD/LRR-repeat protein At1g13570-like n=1 Tax=Bidens hawaiensis TaxID=980011 RepID=UPI00404976DF
MESEFGPKDFISMMPDNVVNNILHRLPLQEAVRTGILSRNWRFKWTMLSEVVCDANFFAYLIERRGENSFGMIASRLLLHFNDAITKFFLDLTLLNVEDILHLIMFVSNKGIKDLTLEYWTRPHVNLPTHIFSCLELQHLRISGCCFNPPSGVRGFPNLLSLKLCCVEFGGGDLGGFITRCPLPEILKLDYISYSGSSVKLAEIAKLENLKILSFPLCHLEATSSCNVFELMGCLPKLQELSLDFQDYNLTQGGAIKQFTTAFPDLKAFKITSIKFGNGIMLSRVLEIIRHFPNLQTLEFIAVQQADDPFPISIPIPNPEVEYNMMELESVEFRNFRGLENEVYFIKYFLACSPSLKKIHIVWDFKLEPVEQLFHAKKLLKLHRASPVAEIDFGF